MGLLPEMEGLSVDKLYFIQFENKFCTICIKNKFITIFAQPIAQNSKSR